MIDLTNRDLSAALIALAAACLALAAPASAASYNYMFPDGSPGFAVTTRGGVVNPLILIGFNPQPEPPAAPATIAFGDPAAPVIDQPADSSSYTLVMSVIGSDTPLHPPEPVMPVGAAFSQTQFSFMAGGHDFDMTLMLTGPGAVMNWLAFNPQPEPPAQWFGAQFDFGGAAADPTLSFSITEDGTALPFTLTATPLPATLSLFASGLGALGLLIAWRTTRTVKFAA